MSGCQDRLPEPHKPLTTPMPHKVALLTLDAPYGRHLAQRFAARFDLVGVIVYQRAAQTPAPPSSPPSPLERMRGALKRRLDGETARLFRVERLEARLADMARERFLDGAGRPVPDWPAGTPVRVTGSVNSEATVDWLKAGRASLLVVAGGPIIRPVLIEATHCGAVNFHGSLLPRYRGTRVEFWQVLDGAADAVGYTIHTIDPGVDTGAILHQTPMPLKPGDTPDLIRVRNQLAALIDYPETVALYLDGALTPTPQPASDEPAWRWKDRTLDRREALLGKLGLL